jgi:hypothetical protein
MSLELWVDRVAGVVEEAGKKAAVTRVRRALS